MVLRYHGNCTHPAIMPTKDLDQFLAVRCRTCPGCLRAKQYLWSIRAELETLQADETVMMTLTFRDQHREREVAERAVTKYLYRLRTYLPYRIRYLACFELTKAGAWHVHMLIHGPRNMHRNTLRKYWKDGYSWARVADLKAAGYVTKYVTKDIDQGSNNRPRIRCSRNPRYGDAVMSHEKDVVQALCAAAARNPSHDWTINAKGILRMLEPDPKKELWHKLNLTKDMHHLLPDGRSVNETTGEISQKVSK